MTVSLAVVVAQGGALGGHGMPPACVPAAGPGAPAASPLIGAAASVFLVEQQPVTVAKVATMAAAVIILLFVLDEFIPKTFLAFVCSLESKLPLFP
jgi:hypothetical protein